MRKGIHTKKRHYTTHVFFCSLRHRSSITAIKQFVTKPFDTTIVYFIISYFASFVVLAQLFSNYNILI